MTKAIKKGPDLPAELHYRYISQRANELHEHPTGGVIVPIMMLSTNITPKCTGSIPALATSGMSTGVAMTAFHEAANASIVMLNTRTRTPGDSFSSWNNATTLRGGCS